MRPIVILLPSLTLACGPLAPPIEAASSTSSATSETTDISTPTTTDPTSTGPVTPPTITDPTTIDITTTGTSSTGFNFIVAPDGGMGTVHCNPFEQDCPRGQKCAPWAQGGGGAWNALKCVDIMGDGQPGDPCATIDGFLSGMDDCALGAFCWNVDENNHGICVAQCTGAPEAPMCPLGFSCAIGGDGILNLCLPGCDPLLQDCPDEYLCLASGDAFECIVDASGDDGQTNDPCEFANSCDKGLVCLDTVDASAACMQGPPGCCQPFCEFMEGQPGACPNPDQQCIQWFDPMEPIPPGLENVGVCRLPP